MGKDFESWLHQRQHDEQFSNVESLKLPFNPGMQNYGIPSAIPCTDAAPMSGPLPSFGFPEQSNFKTGQMKEPHGWFYCFPRFRQGLVPNTTHYDKFMPETTFLGKVSAAANENREEENISPPDVRHAPKQFLVFDRTGNKTTFVLSSMIGTSNQQLNSWNQKSMCNYNVNGDEHGYGSSGLLSGPNLTDELDGENEVNEMHEDTEDIDALLSSDEEANYSDDGEETSTGRSPSLTTAYEKQDWLDANDDMDEVASSAGPSKRQKLCNSSYDIPSITYTRSSFNPKCSTEDDAESSCAGAHPSRHSKVCFFSGNKRERKEKIRETVGLLQTILPGGNGKDAVVVLDEAINYLKTLKLRATSLGIGL